MDYKISGQINKIQPSEQYLRGNMRRAVQPVTLYKPAFTAMKPNQFKGFDYAVVRKFKAPVEKFNELGDLYKWADVQIKALLKMNLKGRGDDTIIQRKYILEEWESCLTQNFITKFTPSVALLGISAMIKDLRADNDKLPPVLDKDLFCEAIDELNTAIAQDKDYQFNLNKIYRNKLRSSYINEHSQRQSEGLKWVTIPSKANDPENFDRNVTKLKILSCDTWCTKGIRGEMALLSGDFHILLEKGQTIFGIKLFGNNILEIQNWMNDSKIPYQYFDILKKHIDENYLRLNNTAASYYYKQAEKISEKMKECHINLDAAIKENDSAKIFEYFGYEPEITEDKTLSINEYRQPFDEITFVDLGIDENKLLNNVSKIRGDVKLEGSNLSGFTNIKVIGGDLDLCNSNITSLGNIERVCGDINFSFSRLKTTGNLKYIGGNAHFENSLIKELNYIEEIGKSLFLNKDITNLGKLKKIGRDISFICDSISLDNLEEIGGDAYFGAGVKGIRRLNYIGGNADFSDCTMPNTANVNTVRGDVYLNKNIINDIEYIYGNTIVD